MTSNPPDKPKSGLSLFASLLDPSAKSSNGTISRAPVVFKQSAEDPAQKQDPAATEKPQVNAAALRFQPTKRPQLSAQKEKAQRLAQAQAKAAAVAAALISGVKKTVPLDAVPETQVAPKTTAADWTNDAEDDDYYAASSKRERGGRKKRKKTKQDALAPQDWDDIYDPSRPNNYEEYRHSDEKIREVREWKDRLYAHRRNRRESSYSESDEDQGPQVNNKFAPPALFAPPPINGVPPPPPSPPSAQEIQASQAAIVNAVPRDHGQTISRVSLPAGDDTAKNTTAKQQGNLQQIPPRSSIHPDSGTTTISRAPVRYNLPEAPTDLPKSEAELEEALRQEEEEPADSTTDNLRSSRPGQKGFAERLMSKYGWTKGSGLGADGSGIINPLRVRVEKQKKRPDSEGGGFVGPGGRGKIVGGQKKPGTEDEGGKFGPMSEVVILRGMLNGMDLEFELGEGNLMQEIGEECGEKYGRVERVYVDKTQRENTPVFIKFTNQLSALRAVNALEGRVFNGNTIVARFFDSETFAKGIYT